MAANPPPLSGVPPARVLFRDAFKDAFRNSFRDSFRDSFRGAFSGLFRVLFRGALSYPEGIPKALSLENNLYF